MYRQASLYCTSLCCAAQILHFLQIEGKVLHQEKDDTHFIATLSLLQWPETEPVISPRCACITRIDFRILKHSSITGKDAFGHGV